MVLARRALTSHLVAWGLVTLLAACATGSGDKKQDYDSPGSSDSGSGGDDEDTDLAVSSTLNTVVFSNANNPLSLHTVNKDKAQDLVKDLNNSLKKPTFKDRKELIALLSVKAVAGFGIDNMLDTAQTLVNLEMSRDIRRDLPEMAKIQIILSAIRTRNFAMAEHFIALLSESKNRKVRSFLSLSEGFIAYLEDRVPEAVFFWTEALKHQSDYAPAKLNLAFVALRYGDHVSAKRLLDGMDRDTFALTGMIIAERIAGNGSAVNSLCSKVSSKDYKPAMFSCALHKFEGEKKYDEAIKLLQDVVKEKPSAPALDEAAYKVIARIEDEKKRSKEREAEERARKAIEKVDKERNASPQQGGAEGGDTNEQKAPSQ